MCSPGPETEYTSLHSRLVYFFLAPSVKRRGRNHAGRKVLRDVLLLLALSLQGLQHAEPITWGTESTWQKQDAKTR